MALYAITGAASGIGAAIKKALLAQGDEVIAVDLRDADINADLSTAAGRELAVDGIRSRASDGLDGFIPCAGLGPTAAPRLLAQVNYFAAVTMTEALCDLLAQRRGSVVLISSNSGVMVEHDQFCDLLLAGDEPAALLQAASLDGFSVYAGSKRALCSWMRRNIVALSAEGIRINAVAPGIVQTALTDTVMADATLGDTMKNFAAAVPTGAIGQPSEIANVVCFLCSAQASFMAGAVVYVDGGHDAMLRADSF